MPGKITMENVEKVFTSVPKMEEANAKLAAEVTKGFIELARTVIANVPDCAHRSAALRDILGAKWACIDAIAKGGEI